MKIKISILITFVFLFITAYSQQNFCADSSFRIKYIFGAEGATLFETPDTTGKNYFTGQFKEGTVTGMAMLKTTWGDSMVWAKKIYMNAQSWNSYLAPGGTIICTGVYGGAISNNPELMLCRIDTNGIVKWINRYRLQQNHLYYQSGNAYTKNLIITNNAIYVVALFLDVSYTAYEVITKISLDGNILWSKAFSNVYGGFSGNQAPTFANNKLYFLSGSSKNDTIIITSLNDADGSISESFSYTILPDASVKAFFPEEMRVNQDNTLSLIGLMGNTDFSGNFIRVNIFFNIQLDAGFNPTLSYYYKNNIGFDQQEVYYDLNNLQQKAVLISALYDLHKKYFISFDKDNNVQRSRQFVLPSNFGTIYRNCIKLDDKQNIHYVYQYTQANKFVNEYARISNFAPNGTLGCFGKDTSILTKYPFTLIKSAFTWGNIPGNVIIANTVPYTTDTAIVTKELVCKIVSSCNKIQINGPANACAGQPVRYTITKNNGCYKNADWIIDTTVANLLSLEGDSAINLSFKKIYKGYIHAALTDCVVKDSFLVNITASPMLSFVKRDSLLCPGKPLTLTATPGFTNYQWQDGTTDDTYTINKPGLYKVTATSYCGIASADSITITNSDTVFTVTSSQTICLYDTAFIALPNGLTNITWQPTGNGLLRNTSLLLFPQQPTLYTINAERIPNCTLTKQTDIMVKICPQTFFMPNSFTPNSDGLNDVFKPAVSLPLAYYHLQIFNRYGQTIFGTSNQYNGWDGTYKGSHQPMGGYIYQCSYRFNGGIQKNVNGYFILVR